MQVLIWRSLGCLVLLVLLGCGRSSVVPSAPSTPSVTDTPVVLQAGSYSFYVTEGFNVYPPTSSGDAFRSSLCLGVGTYPRRVDVPVTVQAEGGGYHVRAVSGTLIVDLTLSGSTVSGTVRGTGADGSGYSVSVDGAAAASIGGNVTGARTASGTVNGQLTLKGPEGYGGCNPTSWGLVSR